MVWVHRCYAEPGSGRRDSARDVGYLFERGWGSSSECGALIEARAGCQFEPFTASSEAWERTLREGMTVGFSASLPGGSFVDHSCLATRHSRAAELLVCGHSFRWCRRISALVAGVLLALAIVACRILTPRAGFAAADGRWAGPR